MDPALRDVEALSRKLTKFSEETQAVAAVAILLREADRNLRLLVVKRVENPKDPWSGQMALPGGRREPGDRSLKETVIRETLEETNIDLANRCRFLGVLEPVRSAVRPGMTVLPFVFVLEHDPEIKLSAEELERYIWVDPKQLIRSRGSVKFNFGAFPAYLIGDSVIWGLTYIILTKLLETLQLPL
ncbi:MAG: CoA pyrophosphatase [Promethearchaeati archaeon SRVP18_Atabeyarchaeia-1]